LTDELDQCKEKEVEMVDKHIQTLQETFQETYWNIPQEISLNKEKQE